MTGSEMPFCSHCSRRATAVKQASFTELPPVLCFHMKRFQQTPTALVKLDQHVACPTSGLDMAPYMQRVASERLRKAEALQGSPPLLLERGEGADAGGEDKRASSSKYDLFAMVEHIGTMDTGHYIAFVRRRGQWYRADDQLISAVPESHVFERRGYMLFYICDGAKMTEVT